MSNNFPEIFRVYLNKLHILFADQIYVHTLARIIYVHEMRANLYHEHLGLTNISRVRVNIDLRYYVIHRMSLKHQAFK